MAMLTGTQEPEEVEEVPMIDLIATDLAITLLAIEEANAEMMSMITKAAETKAIHPGLAQVLIALLESLNEFRTSLLPAASEYLDSPHIAVGYEFMQQIAIKMANDLIASRSAAKEPVVEAVPVQVKAAPTEVKPVVKDDGEAAKRLLSAIFADFNKGATDGQG